MSTPRTFTPRPGQVAVLALVVVTAAAAAQAPSRDESRRLLQKVDAIQRNGEATKPAALVTVVTEREVNAYLAFDGREQLPTGLTQPRVTVLPNLNLSGTAIVDLDAVRAQRQSRGMLDPLNYLTGKLPVAVTGRLQATGGVGRFFLDTASVGGVPVPKLVVEELLAYYSKSAANPRGLGLDDPYPLPARVREIEVRKGEALVKQ